MSTVVAHYPHPPSQIYTPMDSKRVVIKSEDQSQKGSSGRNSPSYTVPRSVKGSLDHGDKKEKESNEATQPLAPPPRPAPSQQNTNAQPDYFSSTHNNSHFSREPNPFDRSFGNPPNETPDSKSLLPSVAALTSPAPLAPEGASAGGYNFLNSLRSGPLSPAMLGGPVGTGTDYFDPQLRGTTFPGVTPNESSLRTGLTPGGGGSMFPAPSPNSQAFIQSLSTASATPSTLDFHRTAVNAAAANKNKQSNTNGTGAQDPRNLPTSSMDPSLQQPVQQPAFGQHDNDAANGLFLLAQATNGQQVSQFAAPATNIGQKVQGRSVETSPNMNNAAGRNGSLTGSAQGSGDISDSGDGKPATRARGKRISGGKTGAASNGRRKAEEPLPKQPPAKKAKNGNTNLDMENYDSDEEPPNIKEEQYHENGRKMTDEEKRKNFLERNRVAALKCRQRKKQWLQNLQAKVEMFSTENDSLTAQVHSLREEIVGLKTLLLQHKDCPVSQNQGLGGYFQQQQQEFNPHANPYGMGIPNGHQGMPGQRR